MEDLLRSKCEHELYLTLDTVLNTWGWLCEKCSYFKTVTEEEAFEAHYGFLTGTHNIHGDPLQ